MNHNFVRGLVRYRMYERLTLMMLTLIICVAYCMSLVNTTPLSLGSSIPARITPGYSEMEAKIHADNPKYSPNDADVEYCILNNWWDLAKKMVVMSHEQGIDLSSKVRSTIAKIQKDSSELLNLLSKNYDKLDVVNVAFQWAESPYEVFLAIKFSPRWSSPGALEVEDANLRVDKDKLEYSGIGIHSGKRKKYQLKLELFGDVIESETKVTPVSIGRFTITLKKAQPGVWNVLTKSSEKLPNQQTWWDMKERYQESCNKFIEENEGTEEL